jgi:hypothetical protein
MKSSKLADTTYRAGLSPTASALKCAMPHSTLALSLMRRSSVNRLHLVSTTKYRRCVPVLVDCDHCRRFTSCP